MVILKQSKIVDTELIRHYSGMFILTTMGISGSRINLWQMYLASDILVDDVRLSMLLDPWDRSKRVRCKIMQNQQK